MTELEGCMFWLRVRGQAFSLFSNVRDWRHGRHTDRTTMHGDERMLAWHPEAVTHAIQPSKWTKHRFDRCKNTATQRRGRAHPPLSNSSIVCQHAPLLFKAKQNYSNHGKNTQISSSNATREMNTCHDTTNVPPQTASF